MVILQNALSRRFRFGPAGLSFGGMLVCWAVTVELRADRNKRGYLQNTKNPKLWDQYQYSRFGLERILHIYPDRRNANYSIGGKILNDKEKTPILLR